MLYMHAMLAVILLGNLFAFASEYNISKLQLPPGSPHQSMDTSLQCIAAQTVLTHMQMTCIQKQVNTFPDELKNYLFGVLNSSIDNYGNTITHRMVLTRNLVGLRAVIKMLGKKHLPLNVSNVLHMTPYVMAIGLGYPYIAELVKIEESEKSKEFFCKEMKTSEEDIKKDVALAREIVREDTMSIQHRIDNATTEEQKKIIARTIHFGAMCGKTKLSLALLQKYGYIIPELQDTLYLSDCPFLVTILMQKGQDPLNILQHAIRLSKPHNLRCIIGTVLENIKSLKDCKPRYWAGNFLHIAVLYQIKPFLLQKLLEKEIDINECDNSGATPLYIANCGSSTYAAECTPFLLNAGADRSLRNAATGCLPVHLTSSLQAAKALLYSDKKSQTVDARDHDGNTPLIIQCSLRNVDIVRLLLARGADPNAFNVYKNSPLHIASYHSSHQLALLKALLDYGVDINATNVQQRTALHFATLQQEVGSMYHYIKMLLKASIDSNAKDINGNSALHYLFDKDHAINIIALLVQYKADINSKGAMGNTMLHRAVSAHKIDLTRMLLRLGADATITNEAGKTPLDYATDNGNEALVQLLQQK